MFRTLTCASSGVNSLEILAQFLDLLEFRVVDVGGPDRELAAALDELYSLVAPQDGLGDSDARAPQGDEMDGVVTVRLLVLV
jgi:hypothetical protein